MDNHSGPHQAPEVRAGIFVADGRLRNLLRTHLEVNGFEVTVVGTKLKPAADLDVVITDADGPSTAGLLVRLVDDEVWRYEGPTLFFPSTGLEELPGVLRAELGRGAVVRGWIARCLER